MERRIADRRVGVTGRMVGAATFTAAPGGLAYEERGVLRFGGHQGEARQGFGFAVEGAAADVAFADGRFFHRVDLVAGRADVAHDCAPDVYAGRYRVLGWDAWVLTWRVRGPRKDLRIGTRFVRD